MRQLKSPRIKLMLFLAALALPALACGGISVSNSAGRALTVRVSLPDGRVDVARIPGGSTEIWWSAVGGPYSVQALPDEQYLERLGKLSEVTQQFLDTGDPGEIYIFSNRLRQGGLDDAFQTLFAIQHRIALEQETAARCSGEIEELDLDLDDVRSPDNVEDSLTFRLDGDVGWSCE